MVRSGVFLVHMALFFGAVQAQDADYFPPTEGPWETLDPQESLGWCTDELDSLHAFLGESGTRSFIVLQGGRIALEWYFGSFTPDSLWYWASAGKVVTGALVGQAASEGLLDLDAPSSDYLGAGWSSCPAEEPNMTVRNHLTMTTGLDDPILDLDCTDPECLECLAEPGSRWAYHNAVYTLLTEVITSASGMFLNSYLNARINQHIGSSLFYWMNPFVPQGPNRVVFSTPRDMARFGLLALRGGVWQGGDTVIPPAYLANAMVQSQSLNPAYGELWWLNGQSAYQLVGTQLVLPGPLIPSAPSDLVAGLGRNDQKLYVIPSMDRVIIRMGDDAGTTSLAASSFDELLWSQLAEMDLPLGVPSACSCAGDLDGDGQRTAADLLLLLGAFPCLAPDSCSVDLNGDGATDVSDVLVMLSGFGVPCSP